MRIKEELVKTEIDDSVVLVPVGEESDRTNFVIELNETAAQICDGIEKGLDANEIAAQLVREYGISPEKASQDVQMVIAQLTEAGAVE